MWTLVDQEVSTATVAALDCRVLDAAMRAVEAPKAADADGFAARATIALGTQRPSAVKP
jgi:hypothetical protein